MRFCSAAFVLVSLATVPAMAAPSPAPDAELSAKTAKILADAEKPAGVRPNGPASVSVGKRTLTIQVAVEQSAVHEKDVVVGIGVHCLIDGQPADALTSGNVGLDVTREAALRKATHDWVAQAAAPIVKALSLKKAPDTLRTGGFWVYPGLTSTRGDPPVFDAPDADRHERLLHEVEPELAKLIHDPSGLHALTVMMVIDGGAPASSECRVDGVRSERLCELAARVPWPRSATTYMLKQFYVLEPIAK
jgi:hypothetical protein